MLQRVDAAASRPSKRRLSSDRIDAFFDAVELKVQERHPGRALSPALAPGSHSHAWATSLLDWRAATHSAHRAARVLRERQAWMLHESARGNLPSGALPSSLKTGVRLLDVNVPHTAVGDLFRRAHSYFEDEHADGAAAARHARLLQQARVATRPDAPTESLLGAMVFAAISGLDPVAAGKRVIEHTNVHMRTSRRLVDGFLGSAASLPVTAGSSTSLYTFPQSGKGWADTVTRYFLYNVVLCFMYKPNAAREDGLPVFRSDRFCFPSIPFAVGQMQSFDEVYQLENVNLNEITYEESCDADAVKSVLDVFGADMVSSPLASPLIGVLLRTAEGFDSVASFSKSGSNVTERERARAVICGITQLGGALLFSVFIIVALVLFVCAPLGGSLCVYFTRRAALELKRRRERDRKVDILLSRQTGEKAPLILARTEDRLH